MLIKINISTHENSHTTEKSHTQALLWTSVQKRVTYTVGPLSLPFKIRDNHPPVYYCITRWGKNFFNHNNWANILFYYCTCVIQITLSHRPAICYSLFFRCSLPWKWNFIIVLRSYLLIILDTPPPSLWGYGWMNNTNYDVHHPLPYLWQISV